MTKKALIENKSMLGRKILQKNINITFTTNRNQRPLSDIIREFSVHLPCDKICSIITNTHSYTSESLVGWSVIHKFEIDNEEKGFLGFIVSYNPRTHLHEIAYD